MLSRGSSAADRRSRQPSRTRSAAGTRERRWTAIAKFRLSRQPRVGVLGKSKGIGQKGKGRREAGPFPIKQQTGSYPFVTTGGGGGALPLPTWALAATLRRASTAAVARASFFMRQTLHFLPQPLKIHAGCRCL
jgi:hypothetical protein